MDSPLLPTFKRKADVSSSPTGLMANISLEPMSPGDSFMFAPKQSSSSQSHREAESETPGPSSFLPSRNTSSTSQSHQAGGSAKPSGMGRAKAAPRFSLFAPNQGPSSSSRPDGLSSSQRSAIDEAEEEEEEEEVGDETIHPDNDHRAVDGGDEVDQAGRTEQAESSAERDDKLRESLYELRQMNEVFDGFLGALEAAKGHNERLAHRVKETSTLLDLYTAILGQQEHTQDLLLNPRWTGAEDDLNALQEEENQRAAAEEAAAAALEAARQAEEDRLAELERAREARETAEARKAAVPARGRGRGGGGTRGLARGSGIPAPSSRGGMGSRPATSSTTTTTTTGIRKPSAGLGGMYANVKSSGYGPTRKAT